MAALSNAGGGNDRLGADLAPPFGSFGTYTPSSYGGAGSVVSSTSAMSEGSSRPRNRPSSKMVTTSRSGGNGVYGGANPNVNMSLNMGVGIGIPPVEEAEWPVRSGEGVASSRGGRRNAHGGPPVLPGLPGIPDSVSSGGGFLMMDESHDESHSNYTTEGSGSERWRRRRDKEGRDGGWEGREGREPRGGSSTRKARTQRPLLSQDDESGSVAPVIRDFDALDVIDDHEP